VLALFLGAGGLLGRRNLVLGVGLLVFAGTLADRAVARRALRRLAVDAHLTPLAAVGERMALAIEVRGVNLPAQVETTYPWPLGPLRASRDRRGAAELVATARGLVRQVVVDVQVRGPLGLVDVRRAARITWDAPSAIGPALDPHPVAWPVARGLVPGFEAVAPTGRELPRGVRPYRPGDPRRQVHWKATAKVGALMVRETEGDATVAVLVVLQMGGPGPGAEAAASRARRAVEDALGRGWSVRLRSAEEAARPDDPPAVKERLVLDRASLLRQLAAAVPAPVPAPTVRSDALVRLISDGGDRWI
jgi:uncharacterized protein (DUF58 family)